MSNFTEKLFVSFLSTLFNIPVVWIEYGNLHEVFKKNFYLPKVVYRLLNKIPKFVIVPSKNTQNSLIVDARVSLSKIKLISLGVKEPHEMRIRHSDFVIGSVSRLASEKGQEYLVKAMPSILKSVPNARLLLVGEGPNRRNLQKLVTSSGLGKHVKFFGYVDDPNHLYENMDIFVFPSIWELEGFGLVLVEAMSHHLPVIAANNGPIPEIVEDNVTGLLVEPKNVNEISKAVINLAKDYDKRKSMGNAGYNRFKKNYTLKSTEEKIYRFLQEATID